MAAEREVIKEFLAKLGFYVEPVSARRFIDVLSNTSKLAAKTGGAIVAVAAAAEAMVQVFARGMEKMYYSSKRNDATVENLQAIRFAFKQIGLDADQAMGIIETFSSNIRTQPGFTALLNNLGVQTDGRDRIEILRDTVKQLSKMEHFVGAMFAQRLGIPEDVFLQWKQNMPAFDAAMEKYLELQRKSGIGAKQAAEDSKEYMNALREIWERVTLLTASIANRLMPAFRQFNAVVNEFLDDLQRWINSGFSTELGEWAGQLSSIYDELVKLKNMLNEDTEANWLNSLFFVLKTEAIAAAHAILDLVDGVLALGTGDWSKAWDKLKSAGRYALFGAEEPEPPAAKDNFANAKIYDGMTGSQRLTHQLMALGMLQKQAGSGKDMTGEEMDALDSAMALAEMRITELRGRGFAPAFANAQLEKKYGNADSKIEVTNSTTINMETSDPVAAGNAVASKQQMVNADLVRNLRGAAR